MIISIALSSVSPTPSHPLQPTQTYPPPYSPNSTDLHVPLLTPSLTHPYQPSPTHPPPYSTTPTNPILPNQPTYLLTQPYWPTHPPLPSLLTHPPVPTHPYPPTPTHPPLHVYLPTPTHPYPPNHPTHQSLGHAGHPTIDMSVHCLHIEYWVLLDVGEEVSSKVGDRIPGELQGHKVHVSGPDP